MSVTCDRSVDFSGCSNFRHKSSNWNIFESGGKHLTYNWQMMDQTFVYVVHNIKHLWVIMWELSVLHFRSSIDWPLNPLPPYPCSNNYFSIPEENIYSIIGGFMKKNYFGWSVVYFIFYLTFVYNCYVPTYHRFLRQIASQISKRHLSAWNIWIFPRRFSRNLTPRETKKIL